MSVRQHLEQTVAMKREIQPGYEWIDALVLKHGQKFAYKKLNTAIYPFGVIKHCFENALCLAQDFDDLTYCEGWASGIIPVQHAWCVTRDGVVVDNTWRKPGAADYFGIPIQTDYAVSAVCKSGYYGVLDNFTERWPILRDDPEKYLAEIACTNPTRQVVSA